MPNTTKQRYPRRALHLIDIENLAGNPVPGRIFSWPGARYLIRSGENGADLELLDVIRHEHVAERFSHVVIASGDGIFAPEGAGLVAKGCHLTVASRRDALSKRLRLAAHRVIYLDAPDMPTAPSQFRPAA